MAGDAVSIPRRSLPWLILAAAIASSPNLREAVASFLRRLLRSVQFSLDRYLRFRPAVRKDFLSVGAAASSTSRGFAPRQQQIAWNAPAQPVQAPAGPGKHGSFADFSDVLPSWLSEGLHFGGFLNMKPIQKKILPLALAGRDVCGVAPTGSGKTLAFLVPGLVHISGQPMLRGPTDGPNMLVLAPTRELAVQIGKVAEDLMRPSHQGGRGFNSAVLYGGARRTDQLQTLRFQQATHLIVATPGRLLDFLEHGAFTLHRVSFFVLDEGDRMLDFGFEPDVTEIARQIRSDRQMLFFSATWPREVEQAALRLCHEGQSFEKVSAQPDNADGSEGGDRKTINGHSLPPREIQQVIEVIQGTPGGGWDFRDDLDKKVPMLLTYLEDALGGVGSETPGKALIFVATRIAAEELGSLVARHFGLARCGVMHGARKQEQREATLASFRTGRIRALVATDVLGRGVDIPNVSHVVIYDFPGDIETYIHRVGRTGRNGQPGKSVAFFEPRPWLPDLTRELVQTLKACEQTVPEDLEREAGPDISSDVWKSWEGGDWWSAQKPEEEKMWVSDHKSWHKAPPVDSDGPGLASSEELGEWDAGGARVWGYSANGGRNEQGRLELRSGGLLRTTWGMGQWSLLPSAAPCPRPSRAPPSAAGREPSPAPGTGEAGTTGNKEAEAPAPVKSAARHLSLSWGGCSDVVSLNADGLGFELVSRSGRPASTFKTKTLGRALPGVGL